MTDRMKEINDALEVFDTLIQDSRQEQLSDDFRVRLQAFRCRIVNLQVSELGTLSQVGEHILPPG